MASPGGTKEVHMRITHHSVVLGLTLALAGGALAACGSSNGNSGSNGVTTSYVDGKTFTLALGSDPGALDPQGAAGSALIQLSTFAYDSLVAVNSKTGSIEPQLAKSWKVHGTTVTFDIGSGITCSDGSTFTAKTVVDNVSYVENPKNKSPFLGVFIPAGATAKASGSTVTLKLPTAAPFVLNSISNLPMVCESGMKNRASLASHTDGTGPYVLTKATPGVEYVYKVRRGYTWGPAGAATSAKGTPAEIDVKIVANETTAANELLAGALNAVQVLGPDAARLKGAGLTSVDTTIVIGEQWYNHAAGHLTSDPAVRKALTEGVDYAELAKVLTSGKGTAATQLAAQPPTGCTGNSVSGNVPAFNVNAAKAALDADGWKVGPGGVRVKGGKELKLTFLYDSALGTGGSAAAQLAVSRWKALGVDVTSSGLSTTQMSSPLFGTGNWDIAWEPINVSTPDQLVPILSGTPAPNGTNFSHLDNAAYSAGVAKATTETGATGCADWLGAESSLFKAADLVPFANKLIPTFAKGATFSIGSELIPTSFRMLG
ncbi:MAG: ABC transporter substrate-binding protein [Nocardioidaceae bacterium]